MNLEHYYYYFPSAIPPKKCDEIIKYGLEQQDQLARTGKFESDEDLNEFSKEMMLHFIENTTAQAAAKIWFGKRGI